MTPDTWLDLGALDDFPEDRPVLRKSAGHRFACVRAGDAVRAIDDRCPHQGYPLSQGSTKDGVLTCEWHNWKFDLASGACTFGGEAVRHYPTRVENGRVHLNPAVDAEREATRLRAGLAQALHGDEMGRALREALRLGEISAHPCAPQLGGLAAGFELLARDSATRAEYGFDHGLAVFADLTAWAERGWLAKEDAFVAAAHAIAQPSLHLAARPLPPADATPADALDLARVSEALVAERRTEAEARVRHIARELGPAHVVTALLPFLARHLYDYGHGAIFVAKAVEIAERFPAVAEDILGAVTATLSWATAETSLPPFTATRAALARLEAIAWDPNERAAPLVAALAPPATIAWDPNERAAPLAAPAAIAWDPNERAAPLAPPAAIAWDPNERTAPLVAPLAPPAAIAWDPNERAAYERAVLSGEADAAAATVDWLARGASPAALLRAIAHAAAERVRRFDSAWEERLDAEVGVLDVTHAVTFAESALVLQASAEPRHAARLAVLAAAFVGKLRKADRADLADPAPRTTAPDLLAAAQARDPGRAIAIARQLSPAERRAAYAQLAPFAALDAAVRPILYAHTVKNTEALSRLDRDDPAADATYLVALLSHIVPQRREWLPRRVAHVARTFLADGRPPEGLY